MPGISGLYKDLPFRPFPRGRANHHVFNGDTFRGRRDWMRAAIAYRQALQIEPHRRAIWVQLGHALKESGALDPALDAYRQGSLLAGQDGDAPLHLGLLAMTMGHTSLSVAGLTLALREVPEQPDAQRALRSLLGDDVDVKAYVANNADALAHDLRHRLATTDPTGQRDHGTPGTHGSRLPPPRHVIVKEMALRPGGEAALMVAHAPAGRLKPHVLPYIRQLRAVGLQVLLVVVVDRPLELLDEEKAEIDGIIVRDNGGYDFGAWADGFRLCPALLGASLLVMTNDSVIPTADTATFQAMMARVHACPADIVGLTASHEYGWHLQSYFLAFKPAALSSWSFQHFFRDIRRLDDKARIILTYEVPFATRMRAAGLKVQALFSGPYASNPTFFSWKELIEQGFPFIKLLILRKEFAKVADWPDVLQDIQDNWHQVTAKAGFDVDLIRQAIQSAEIALMPAGDNTDLVIDADRLGQITDDHPLRIAYFGPWNYDNGLGSASRELLCTLRHMDGQLNAYPIQKPFHIHRQICPAVATIDFQGQADVAIVHLNPDSWHVLTDEQRAIIRSAKRRVGYWVWETDRLPPAWDHDLRSVDRIWAPSAYCAEVFATATGLPVDVVPHPVRLPSRICADRASVLRRFGIDPASRVILYVFDGASYLIRKNPHALVRAFAATGLADKGWELVLKTKHLHDRPEAGAALAQLVEQTKGASLLEISMHAEEVTSLLAAADLYASPHCAEGFGLTVAEAMAVGKPVVATDYSGTRDFLQAEWGYPVAASLWTLEEDHGHYLAGHTWGKVDEVALAAALAQAAGAIDRGERKVGEAAREAVRRLLSYDAVAGKIATSLAALVDEPGHQALAPAQAPRPRTAIVPPEPPHVHIDLSSATTFDRLAAKDGVIPVPLAPDLSWDGRALPGHDADDWLFLAPRDAAVAPDAVATLLAAASRRPDVVLFYADDVAVRGQTGDNIRLKPDFDLTMLIASDYVGAPVIVRRQALTDIGGLDPSRGTAVLYDLVLRMAAAGGTISRIPHVLIGHHGHRPLADMQARRAAIIAGNRLGGVDLVEAPVPGLLRQRLSPGAEPAVSIIIPTRQTPYRGSTKTYVESLLDGIAQADWPKDRLTVIVGDDLVGEPAWAKRPWPFTLRRVETPRAPGEPFNYARKMNHLWRMAGDEQVIFMNDDASPRNALWLRALLTFSSQENVGGVGARLYYEDGSIQHAGMVPCMRTVAHAWLNWPADAPTYQDWAITQREWSMVTGAIFATRRSVLDQLNGFDEKFSLEFNDVDLCLRIRNLGYRIVYNPDAEFTHAEKASRGERLPPGQEMALFLSRWSEWLEVDPSWHPHLAANRLDPTPAPPGGAWYL